jgi:hypothetical protein
VIRLHALEALGLAVKAAVKDMAEMVVPSASTPPLRIDGRDPTNYHPLPWVA